MSSVMLFFYEMDDVAARRGLFFLPSTDAVVTRQPAKLLVRHRPALRVSGTRGGPALEL